MTQKSLDGNEIAWQNDEVKCYTTNFGTVEVDVNTEEFMECCIGLGRNYPNTQISIKIFDDEFQVSKDTFGSMYAELCSKNFPYPRNPKYSIEVLEIIQILKDDDNDSIAAVLVKRELIKLMYQKLKLTRAELKALNELVAGWRKPILTTSETSVERHPIVTRTPITTKGGTKS